MSNVVCTQSLIYNDWVFETFTPLCGGQFYVRTQSVTPIIVKNRHDIGTWNFLSFKMWKKINRPSCMLHWHNKRQQKNTFEDVIKEWFIEAFFNTTAKRKLAANISYIFVYIKVFCKQKNKNWYDIIQYGTIQICANIWFAFI